jgi:uncharacterized protein (DUF342 family)
MAQMQSSSSGSGEAADGAAVDDAPLRVIVSQDLMTAELRAQTSDPLTLQQVAAAISVAGLPVPSNEKLAELLGSAEPRAIAEPIVIAKGIPPVDDQPARFEMLLGKEVDPNAKVSHYDRHQYLTAATGQPLARVHPRVEGKDGIDVFGKPAQRNKPADERFVLGMNVQLQPDGISVVAKSDGQVKLERGKLWVEPLMDVKGDVDFSVGNIDFACDVHVHKNVLDLFVVKSKQNVIIDGAIEAAEVSAGADLHVGGGICGKDKGRCTAGGNVEFKFATNAIIRAGGNLTAQVEIASTQIICGGVLDISEGSIIGGSVQARGGIKCATLGSASATKTFIEAGTDPALRARLVDQIKELRAMQKRVQELRESVAPLMQNQKALSAKQKEQVTEVLFEIQESDTKATSIIKELRLAFEQMRVAAKQEVYIAKCVYPGVTVRFPDVECTIDHEIRGPVRIIPRMTKTGIIGCAMSAFSAQSGPLPSRPVHDDVMGAAIRALGLTPNAAPPPASAPSAAAAA